MTLESQVCSLELAKKLKELGVKQESYFYWAIDLMGGAETEVKTAAGATPTDVYSWDFASAFTVAELGEMLKETKFESSAQRNGKWVVHVNTTVFPMYTQDNIANNQLADTEADARAKMLAYLLENHLIPSP
jgi:hypothetical protein